MTHQIIRIQLELILQHADKLTPLERRRLYEHVKAHRHPTA